MTWPATTSGDAYTLPSTPMVQATFGDDKDGSAGPAPDRPASRGYSVHSDEIGGEGVGVTREPEDGPAVLDPEAHATVARTRPKPREKRRIFIGAPANSRRAAPQPAPRTASRVL